MIKELKYELTKEDLGNFVKDALCIKRYKKERLNTAIILAFIPIIGLIITIIQIIIQKPNNIFDYLFPFVFLLFIFAGFGYFMYSAILKSSALKLNKDTDFLNNKVIINSELDTIIELNNSYSEYNWSKIKDIHNLKYNIIIFTQPYIAIIIPKRIFETEQEMNETWELIQECYNKYKEN